MSESGGGLYCSISHVVDADKMAKKTVTSRLHIGLAYVPAKSISMKLEKRRTAGMRREARGNKKKE